MRIWLCKYLIVQLIAFSLPTSYSESLLSLSNLIHHFSEHARNDHDHDFVNFLKDHYTESQHHQSDHDEHQKLPFHNHSDGNIGISMQTLTVAPETQFERSIQSVIISSNEFPAFSPTILSTYLDNIWQPPRA